MVLGETLVGQGVISADQLNKALDAQKSTPGKKIGEILVEMGFASADAIQKALG
jgi:type IV pilus assembly protein PilB